MRRAWTRAMALLLAAAIGGMPLSSAAAAPSDSRVPAEDRLQEIDAYVRGLMAKSGIPGLAVAIVEGKDNVLVRGYGWADRAAERPVTERTLFELGSTSKAFTALAVMQLEAEGLLDLDAHVDRYLPWLHFRFRGTQAQVTLRQLLHHTSGVPFRTIGDIPAADDEGALERTVRMLDGLELAFEPGEKYSYATINYDVLGLIVQEISGIPFERYMRERILAPLGLNGTYLYRAPEGADMAQGYKFGLMRPNAYDAPAYRGNTPAGYVVSSAADMASWLKVQLGVSDTGSIDPSLVRRTQLPDRTVAPGADGASYAAGWAVFQRGSGELLHDGSNPNFSSYVVIRPHDGIGVAVLANLSSAYTQTIGQGVMNLIIGKKLPDPAGDLYRSMDGTASAVLFLSVPLIVLTLWRLGVSLLQAARGERRWRGGPARTTLSVAVLAAVLGGFGYCLLRMPDVLYDGLNWRFMAVWAPFTLSAAAAAVFAAAFLFGLYYTFTLLCPKTDERIWFPLIVLSLVSGFGNALIIFVVNQALNRGEDAPFPGGLLMYLIAGIAVYVVGQKLVRTRLIRMSNDMVYRKRTELTSRILNASYRRVEQVEYGKIQAALNNDTETLSDFSNIVVTGATSFVTLMCCFVYMGTISVYGLLVSLLVIVGAAGLHFLFGRQAQRIWEQTRDIQNAFFAFIHHMTSGFKELSLHEGKRAGFRDDMIASSRLYRDTRIRGEMKFANVNVIGELLFSLVVGVIAFLFPVLFPAMQQASIRSYVFVLLYMTGPIHGILGTIPNLIRLRISWKRIQALAEELDSVREKRTAGTEEETPAAFQSLELDRVVYRHPSPEEGQPFAVGPVSLSFRAGEITFITGGNGSGKSTLARLATGLYAPDEGTVRVNGIPMEPDRLGRHYSAVFSDFHLFEKLYGLDAAALRGKIDEYLFLLRLHDKVQIREGTLGTPGLSTGQRKRLALLISYLEDRPVYLFDEWAADQDPEFRRFFYETLLPELRERNKCVIAITHDDRYFGMADRIVKLELGKVTAIESAGRLADEARAEAAG
ncbi:cyclic peptide export ABC transporter [Cohnella sp. CFH 77786]|uniref:cyclic peptide export ABC transporter n=1 Tax=Cohnella sp. CFH 77786 TaxID=2662265 RepID=UPI001C60E7E6|nr:cyclic peptide export ABC transporter [Cohnella sp. CFH 77786]MBW5446411.1 cyclic peptide export ABC transporter [Cohnella sp. CFH 77786]